MEKSNNNLKEKRKKISIITIFTCSSGLTVEGTCTIGSCGSNEDFIQGIVIQTLQNITLETAIHYCEIVIIKANSVVAYGIECEETIDVYFWRSVPGEGELGWDVC